MKIVILSSGTGFGGRGKALLSLCDYLSQDFDITVLSDRLNKSEGDGITIEHLVSHHSIYPDVGWVATDFSSGDYSIWAERVSATYRPDAVIGFDSHINPILSEFSCPTVAYCRRGISDWADEYWTPSKSAADRHNAWLREHDLKDNCYPVYPIWYIEKPNSVKPFDEREYDILVHRRKAEEVGQKLSDFSVHYASDYKWDELTEVYQNSKVFLFPNKSRFEPLGLMPIEAAAFGCHLSLPRKSGVAEIYPECVYRKPEEAVEELLEEDEVSDLSIPESPTDPIERLSELTKNSVTI